MAKWKVCSDEELFDSWKRIGTRIAAESSIVQNNMILDSEEMRGWQQRFWKLNQELSDLFFKTLRHAMSCEVGPSTLLAMSDEEKEHWNMGRE